jgi:hypothetical protein
MRSGDRPGLQNRRAAGNPVTGGFDPHSLPPKLEGELGFPAVSLPLSASRGYLTGCYGHFIHHDVP